MEASRALNLKSAQEKATSLFDEIARTLIRPGISESQLSKEIHALGSERHGVRTHWHKRVVRSGPNTLQPYVSNPPDRLIEEDDILFVDLGPVFEAWEADFGRTFVLGSDPQKIKLRDSLEPTWKAVKTSSGITSPISPGSFPVGFGFVFWTLGGEKREKWFLVLF